MTKIFGTHRRPVTIVVLALALAGVIAILFAMRGPRPTADRVTSPVAQAPSAAVAPVEAPQPHSSRLRGVLEEVVDGVVRGWAVDTAHPNEPVRILFHLEEPKGYGGTELVLNVFADKPATDGRDAGEVAGNHAFVASMPAMMGDRKDHRVYGYALIDGEAVLIPGSPLTFNFYAPPPATLAILSPKDGEIVLGPDVTIRYEVHVTGYLPPSAHIHWRLDDRPEYHDRDRTGSLLCEGLTPGMHRLTGALASGHHDKMVNTTVTVTFETREAPLR